MEEALDQDGGSERGELEVVGVCGGPQSSLNRERREGIGP